MRRRNCWKVTFEFFISALHLSPSPLLLFCCSGPCIRQLITVLLTEIYIYVLGLPSLLCV